MLRPARRPFVPTVRVHGIVFRVSGLKLIAGALLVLGCVMLLTQSQHLVGDDDESFRHALQLMQISGLRHTSDSGASTASASGNASDATPAVPSLNLSAASSRPDPGIATTPTPTPSLPAVDCYNERDNGLIERIAQTAVTFCAVENSTTSPETQITTVDVPGGIRAAVFSHNLVLDLTAAAPFRPIASMAYDGGAHDPRFRFSPRLVYCACDTFTATRSRNVWDPTFAFASRRDASDPSLWCMGPNAVKLAQLNAATNERVEIPGHVVLIARRDDHNPFFQVSAALNAWLVMKALQWDPQNATLIHLDAGYPSPIYELHQKLLAPTSAVLDGGQLRGQRLWFSAHVLVPPFESTGPMMQHLEDPEPCFDSQLFHTFRNESLATLKVSPTKRDEVIVTIISRQPVQGRSVQRVWLNEAEILMNLRAEYSVYQGRPIVFQNIEFAALEMATQMQLMLDSDVVIGMHGAGMVNVLWTRPGTLVLEIFPLERKRWGFRNLCQFLGCEWHEFRGGSDIRRGPGDSNANDKSIPYGEWRAFFDPLFRHHITKITSTSK